ncbi:hypothetical protein [Microscilla marina]|uniref:Uncharacterized protein n=1 Tax=Microscilla marina ATCC 23134 TaxID=313606 RepID=A1ZPS1_MICM2|nr:hypothetical protein [Microscilla marina]EAY27576.1 hypothetical protein M23134_02823 [Microscilla marina ATCC 23134]
MDIEKASFNFDSLSNICENYYNQNIKASSIKNDEDAREILEQVADDLIDHLVKLCALKYTQDLEKYDYPVRKFKNDILNSISSYNWSFIQILTETPFIYNKSFRLEDAELLRILNILVEPYETKKNQGEELKAGLFFEYFLDHLEYFPQEEALRLMDKMLGFDTVNEDWYEAFLGCFSKLKNHLPKNKKGFDILKKGFLIPDIGWTFKNFIKQTYMKENLVDERYNWIENN